MNVNSVRPGVVGGSNLSGHRGGIYKGGRVIKSKDWVFAFEIHTNPCLRLFY